MRRLSILLPILVVCCTTQSSSPPATTTVSEAPATPQITVATPPPPVPEEGLRPNENLIFGHNYKFALATPAGLNSDAELARNLRIDAIFYPPGSGWNDELSLSSRVLPKTATAGLAEVITQDEAEYKDATPAVVVTEQPPIPLSNGAQARVRYFVEDPHSLHEAVAYIDQRDTVALIVLRGNSDEQFKKSLPLFDALVRSYRNLDNTSAGSH
jgi:hypothetical protein